MARVFVQLFDLEEKMDVLHSNNIVFLEQIIAYLNTQPTEKQKQKLGDIVSLINNLPADKLWKNYKLIKDKLIADLFEIAKGLTK